MFKKQNYLLVALFIQLTMVATPQEPFVLITMLFNETDTVRKEEYKTCLLKNKAHPLIDTIHVWYDTSKDTKYNELYQFLLDIDVIIETHNGRMSFGNLFEIASTQYPNRRIIGSNADIYFNETLALLDEYDLTGSFLAITRWDLLKNGSLQIDTIHKRANTGAHDSWIFQSPLFVPGAESIYLGTYGCDGGIAHQVIAAKLKILNPCYSIICTHLHHSPVRHYGKEKRYEGNKTSLKGTTLPIKNISPFKHKPLFKKAHW